MGNSLMTDLDRVIHLYRQMPRYDKYTYAQLAGMILPSINLDQYQIHRLGKQDVGFTNWAFINDIVQQRYKTSGRLKDNEWNCGKNIWVMAVVAKSNAREIINWVKEYFKPKLEVNECVKWLRVSDDNNIYRASEKYKRGFHI
jgi:hemolysin-activating ACP:hemolysin acyltransferase